VWGSNRICGVFSVNDVRGRKKGSAAAVAAAAAVNDSVQVIVDRPQNNDKITQNDEDSAF